MMALGKTNNSVELNTHDGSIEQNVNDNLEIEVNTLRQPK